MKLGIIIYSNDSETVWNAFRLAVFSCNKKDTVKVFLLAKGVESESLDTEIFQISKEMSAFIEAGGEVLACGSCLKIRQSKETDMCPISTMADLYEIINKSDRVITF